MKTKLHERFYINQYELCVELWHTLDENGDTVVSHREVYRYFPTWQYGYSYAGLPAEKVKRAAIPPDVLKDLDVWLEERWWHYVNKIN